MNNMLYDRDSLIEVCEIVAEKENLRVAAVSESPIGTAVTTGSSIFIGAIIGGPIGLLVGGAVGSIASAMCSWKQFNKSVVSILRYELTLTQKLKLENSIRRIMNNVSAEDATAFLILVLTRENIKALVIKEIANFLLKEMGVNIIVIQ